MNRRRRWLQSAVLAAACVGAASCGGGDDVEGAGTTAGDPGTTSGPGSGAGGDGSGGSPAGTGGDNTGGSGTGGSMIMACEPGATQPCYTGPKDTQGVGTCVGGLSTCLDDGSAFGPCVDEVTPSAESCATSGDEDCDGQTNEEGAQCACVPGTTASCYSGPPDTENVGACKGGQQVCNADGLGYGPCMGEIGPAAETCASQGDDDCDGMVNEEGAECVCVPGATKPCYTGPMDTQGVGLCKGGVETCNAQGTGFGACTGEVLPAAETCMGAGDEDCDGQANESGAGCVCVPGATEPCYSGPMGTQGVGVCQGGTHTCNPQGTGFGACAGEVVPGVENCNTAVDENCDGQTPACQGGPPIIDLRADANRNGTVDLDDPTEDAGEDTWSQAKGAVFLANIDDDQKACPTANQNDAQLAACHDGADTVINGPDDLADLARLKTVPWPEAPVDAKATISVSAPGATYVRLFKNVGGTFQVFNPASAELSAADLAAGVELAIEGKDIVRDAAVWNGRVKITLNVDAGTGPSGPLPDGSDTVELRIAPVIFRHHLDEATTVYTSKINNNAGSTAFRADLLEATQAAAVPNGMVEFTVGDQWNQDYFETAYMSMPGVNGQQKVIHVNVRSANYTGSLRAAGKTVYTILRGKDNAGLTVYDPAHDNGMDTLNSFGNLETLPPYTKNGTALTLGRVLRGSTPSFFPDKSFDKMITSQSVQSIFYIDTEWLLVGHVDETLSYIKASTPHGWAMLATRPLLAKTMLEQQQAAGFGSTPMFVGKFWSGNQPAQVTINQVLNDTDVMNETAWAAVKIQEQIDDIKAETGITDAEIIPVPTLFMQASGYSVAYTPGTVNGIYLSDNDFGPPDPHGPTINGQDIWKAQLEGVLAPYGVNVRWIEDWDLYHRLDGEVHCGSNTTRSMKANIKWWESGL